LPPTPLAPPLDVFLGMFTYLSKEPGVGGRIRCSIEEFVVIEEVEGWGVANAPEMLDTEGLYAVYVLEKRGVETFETLDRIATELGVPRAAISIAGIKDKYARTLQFLTVKGGKPLHLEGEGFSLSFIGYSTKPASPARLMGNRFDITIREVIHMEEAITRVRDLVEEVCDKGGFPNFYGYQRFGAKRPINHIVGWLLLEGAWSRAIEVILATPALQESQEAREFRVLAARGATPEELLTSIPPFLMVEHRILSKLKETRSSLKALRALPARLRSLLVQSYQSFLFNIAVSTRILLKGHLLPSIGDYVLRGNRAVERVEACSIERVLREVQRGVSALAVPLPSASRKVWERFVRVTGILLPYPDSHKWYRNLKAIGARLAKGWRSVTVVLPSFAVEAHNDALRVSFTLPRGCYATVVLREIMKPQDPLAAGF